jgi:type II secretory pathway component GspD/PulD (secretin)
MESGIIRVDKIENLREQEKIEELVTRPFTIKYASVDSLLPAVKGLLSNRGTATTSSATNSIVVTDGRSIVEGRIAPMIEQLDARTPQVEIAAKIIFVNRTAMDQLGVSYELQDRAMPIGGMRPGTGASVGLTGNAIAALGNATQDARVTGATFQFISTMVLGRYRLNAFIDALTSINAADVEARPVVRTLDHREASVQVGEETPIRVVDVGQGGAAPPRANVQLKNTGIILKVTPHVTGNQVLLEVHAERSGVRLVPESDIGMVFDKQESKVQVLVNNGETAVISGLTIVEKKNAVLGIPVLKSIPILGALFRKTLTEELKKDLLIMVTPHSLREAN